MNEDLNILIDHRFWPSRLKGNIGELRGFLSSQLNGMTEELYT